jgi:parallel beta-helix repeat protein
VQIKSILTALNLLTATVLGFLVMASFVGMDHVEPLGPPTCPNAHDPILINENVNFTAANGVTGGSGTLFDPYKIEGWSIDAFASANGGIFITNTDAHFVVTNVCVLSGSLNPPMIDNPGITFSNIKYGFLHNSLSDLNSYGLAIFDSQSVGVEDIILTQNGGALTNPSLIVGGSSHILISQNEIVPAVPLADGIVIGGSSEVEVKSNIVTSAMFGIVVSGSSSILVEGNTASNSLDGVYVTDSQDVHVNSNVLFPISGYGINIYQGSDIIVTGNNGGGGSQGISAGGGVTGLVIQGNEMYGNTFSGISVTTDDPVIIENNLHGNGDGMTVVGDGALILGNDASHNENRGIWLQGSTNATVIGNTVSYNDIQSYSVGICVCNGATGTVLHHNNIIANPDQAWDLVGPENAWHNGYPSGGNFWSDYAGVDDKNGPNQDLTGSDGIGDTPYIIDSDSQDPYPRMTEIPPFPLDIGQDITLDEGDSLVLTASAGGLTEPDLQVTWDFRDDVDSNNDGNPINDIDATGVSVSHTYGDDGTFAVTATATYFSVYTDMDQLEVTVQNVPPAMIDDIDATLTVNITLRVAGEKWHDVTLEVLEGNSQVGTASVTREPGSPNDQAVTLNNVAIDIMTGNAVVEYTPLNDVINGNIWGADPAWLILTFEDGTELILNHTFNVRHPDTWIWTLPSFGLYLVDVPLTFEATASEVGSDDLTFTWSWGDSSPDTISVYFNDGVNPDPDPSPQVNPVVVKDGVKHSFGSQGTFTVMLIVEDDDGGQASSIMTLTL